MSVLRRLAALLSDPRLAIVLLLFFSCMVQSPFVHPEGKLEWTNTVRNPTLCAAVTTHRFPACADPVACAPSLPLLPGRGGEEPEGRGRPVRGHDGHFAVFLEGQAVVVGTQQPVLNRRDGRADA